MGVTRPIPWSVQTAGFPHLAGSPKLGPLRKRARAPPSPLLADSAGTSCSDAARLVIGAASDGKTVRPLPLQPTSEKPLEGEGAS
jgi:hypothetical protein